MAPAQITKGSQLDRYCFQWLCIPVWWIRHYLPDLSKRIMKSWMKWSH